MAAPTKALEKEEVSVEQSGGTLNELEVMRDVSERLERAGIAFMITGSFAMTYYAEPRMTRDIDFVVKLQPADVRRIPKIFEPEYYVSPEAVHEAVSYGSSFNVIHKHSVVKVDCFVRKSTDYDRIAFQRRIPVTLGGAPTYIATREDLILSKLNWARESHSEMQRRDLKNLLSAPYDERYVQTWIEHLGLADTWRWATA